MKKLALLVIVALLVSFGLEPHAHALTSLGIDHRPPAPTRALRRSERRALKIAMSGPSNAKKASMLDLWLGNGTPVTTFLAAFTVMPADDGTGGTEVTGSAYARVSITNNTTNYPNATSANPSVKQLAISASFPAATADWMSGVNVVGFGLYDASTAGTFLGSAYALSSPQLVTVDASTDLFTCGASHSYSANDALRFVISTGGTLPTLASGSLSATTVYVSATGLTATAFKISLTQGGAVSDVTAAAIGGALRVFKSYVGPVINGTTLTINANQLQFQLQGF